MDYLKIWQIKTAVLFALTHPCRDADLAALDLTGPSVQNVLPSHLSQQSQSSHSDINFFLAIKDHECLLYVQEQHLRHMSLRQRISCRTKERIIYSVYWSTQGSVLQYYSYMLKILSPGGRSWYVSIVSSFSMSRTFTKAEISGVTVEDIIKAVD